MTDHTALQHQALRFLGASPGDTHSPEDTPSNVLLNAKAIPGLLVAGCTLALHKFALFMGGGGVGWHLLRRGRL